MTKQLIKPTSTLEFYPPQPPLLIISITPLGNPTRLLVPELKLVSNFPKRSWTRSRTCCESGIRSVSCIKMANQDSSNPGKKQDDEVLYGSGATGTSGTTGTTGTTGPASSTTGTTGLGSSTTGTHDHHTSNITSGLGSDTTRAHDPLTSHNSSALGDTSSRTAGAYDNDTASTTAIRGGIPGTNTHSGSGLTDTSKPLPNEPDRLGTFGHLEEGGRKNEPFSPSTDPTRTTDTTGTGLTGSHHTGSGITGSHNTGSGITGTDHSSATQPTTGTSITGAGLAGSEYGSTTLPDRSVGG